MSGIIYFNKNVFEEVKKYLNEYPYELYETDTSGLIAICMEDETKLDEIMADLNQHGYDFEEMKEDKSLSLSFNLDKDYDALMKEYNRIMGETK